MLLLSFGVYQTFNPPNANYPWTMDEPEYTMRHLSTACMFHSFKYDIPWRTLFVTSLCACLNKILSNIHKSELLIMHECVKLYTKVDFRYHTGIIFTYDFNFIFCQQAHQKHAIFILMIYWFSSSILYSSNFVISKYWNWNFKGRWMNFNKKYTSLHVLNGSRVHIVGNHSVLQWYFYEMIFHF